MKSIKIVGDKKRFARVEFDSWHSEHIDIDGLSTAEAAAKVRAAKTRHEERESRMSSMRSVLSGKRAGRAEVVDATIRPRGTDVELAILAECDGERRIIALIYPNPEDVPTDAEILAIVADEYVGSNSRAESLKRFEDDVKSELGV